jgi:hypothetical protein
MANDVRITLDDRCAEAHDFVLADDLYLFFKFGSPNSRCEIGIAYDQFVGGGDWYVNDGHLGGCDRKLIDEIVFEKLPVVPEFARFNVAVDTAIRKFNGMEEA